MLSRKGCQVNKFTSYLPSSLPHPDPPPRIDCRQMPMIARNQQLAISGRPSNETALRRVTRVSSCLNSSSHSLSVSECFLRSRSDTALEVLALRQQVAVLKRKRPRPKLPPL